MYLCSGSLCAVGCFAPEHTKLQLSEVRNIILWKIISRACGVAHMLRPGLVHGILFIVHRANSSMPHSCGHCSGQGLFH